LQGKYSILVRKREETEGERRRRKGKGRECSKGRRRALPLLKKEKITFYACSPLAGGLHHRYTLFLPLFRTPLEEWVNGPLSIVRFVRRITQPVILPCTYNDAQFGSDPYIMENNVTSIMCIPILLKNILKVN
jgi:hypothetical protein